MLGRVKFMFPNSHNVYLHDSSARNPFERNVRAFSHGCVRLSRPLDLAEQVLRVGGVQGWNKERINDVVASTKNTVVNLREPLPVHITYLTAWADDGVAIFARIFTDTTPSDLPPWKANPSRGDNDTSQRLSF